ncbi:MAG: hypothetical protein WBV82_19520 [Myxococcaceae bacterium]
MSRIRSRANRSTRVWALGLSLASTAALAEVRTGDEVVIRQGEVVGEDLYVFANRVEVEGVVEGDLLAFTSELDVPGRVTGDVMAIAGDIDITGQIGGSVRAGTGTLRIMGPVGEDVLAAAGEVELGRHATVGRDVIVSSGDMEVASEVEGDVRAAAGMLALDGMIHGDARVRANELSVGDDAEINGTLRHGSAQAEISQAARIGNVEKVELQRRARGPAAVGWFLLGWLRWAVGLFALGLIVRLLFPKFTRTVPETLQRSPWKSLGIGAAVLFVVPIAAMVLFVVGAFIGGWWIGLIALGVLSIAIAVSFPMVGLFVGDWLLTHVAKAHVRAILALLVGVVLLSLVIRLPIVGALVALATILFGLGALTVSGWRLRPVQALPAPT